MTSRARFAHLWPRLLLCVVMVTCVLGLSEAGGAGAAHVKADATAVSAIAGVQPAMSHAEMSHAEMSHAVMSHGGMAGPSSIGGGTAQAPAAPMGGHGGHGDGGGMHVVTCMASTGAPAVAVLALPALAGDGVVLPAPVARLRSALLAAQYPRPPDRASLCVSRV